MKKLKLFLHSGKLMYGSSLDDQSAVEVVNPESITTMFEGEMHWIIVPTTKDGHFFDLPIGWAVKIEEKFEKNVGYESPENQNRDNPILGFKKKVAILVPVNIEKAQPSGIVATGEPESGEPEPLIEFPVYYTRGQIFDNNRRKICNLSSNVNVEPKELGELLVSIINAQTHKRTSAVSPPPQAESQDETAGSKYEEAAKEYANQRRNKGYGAFLAGASFAEKELKVELSNYAYEADRAKRDRDIAEAREKEAHNAAIDKAKKLFNPESVYVEELEKLKI